MVEYKTKYEEMLEENDQVKVHSGFALGVIARNIMFRNLEFISFDNNIVTLHSGFAF